jgi:S-DNA-T family DNA segregation ATPase FtsK/SpoIIIE
LPPTDFLTPPPPRIEQKDEALAGNRAGINRKTKEFNVTGRVDAHLSGSGRYDLRIQTRSGRQIFARDGSWSDDLCLALKAESIRIDRIPGKAFVGIEVPNRSAKRFSARSHRIEKIPRIEIAFDDRARQND